MFRAAPLQRTFEAALRDLEAREPAVRASAATDLAEHAPRARSKVLSMLEQALCDKAPEVRSAAAIALADVGGVEALPSLLFAVEDDHPHVRQMALSAVGELGDPRARERLRRALGDERPEVRFQAVIAFARVAPDEAMDALIAATHDGDPSIRYIAIRCAEERVEEGGGAMPEAFLARARELLDDTNDAVRVGAAIVLTRSGDRRGVPLLVDVVRGLTTTAEAEDEAMAVELMGELGIAEASPHLERRAFGLLSLREGRFAWQAMVALARLGHAKARGRILRDLHSWSRDKRTLAVAAAGRALVVEARPFIEAMRGDESRAECAAVELALQQFDRAGLGRLTQGAAT
ncbi:MAG TPA: HEAT repeat domain-containing protein [Polyangiaceae bacterium]|nr:HEAT repeat domain-containing protein [Polyangiaceae bacterium]